MENDKERGAGEKTTAESRNSIPAAAGGAESASETAPQPAERTPFTSLAQVDADLALARALQEQEWAYMRLRMSGGDGSDYASSESESYGYEEDAFDANDRALGPADFDSDEAYARVLQDAEEHELSARLTAGLNDWGAVYHEDHASISQDAWQEVDPDQLSYEELIALGEAIGTKSRGLSVDTVASLPSVNFKSQNVQGGNTDQCVICLLDYEDGDSLVVLSCKHRYHSECINKWLQINKVCPICNAEVSTSGSKQD